MEVNNNCSYCLKQLFENTIAKFSASLPNVMIVNQEEIACNQPKKKRFSIFCFCRYCELQMKIQFLVN